MSDELHTLFSASTDIPTLIAHLEALIATNKETPNHRMHSHHALQFFERADIPAKARVATLVGKYHVLAYNSPSPTPAMEAIQLLNEAITGTPVTQSLAASTPDVVRASVAVCDTRVVLFRNGSELLHGRAADFPSSADECAVFTASRTRCRTSLSGRRSRSFHCTLGLLCTLPLPPTVDRVLERAVFIGSNVDRALVLGCG